MLAASALEFPVYALCGSGSRDIVYPDVRDLRYGTLGQFTIVRCSRCKLSYLYPRPTKEHLAEYYPTHYWPLTSSTDTPERSSKVRTMLYRVLYNSLTCLYRVRFGNATPTLRPFGGRRMLDVGCGAGEYLQNMQELGWDVYGVDLSDIAVRAANERVGASRVCVGTIETLDPSLKALDLITMNHVLEHVPDPRSTLEEASRRIALNGKLKVIVPDISGFEAKLFGRYWVGLDVPRHLYDFSGRTLGEFLQQSGFRIKSVRPQWWPNSFADSFNLAAELELHIRWRRLRRILKIVFYLFFNMLSYPLGNRGAIEVVADKIRQHE